MLDTGIYAIWNRQLNKVYVGSTKRGFEQRWLSHRQSLNRCWHANSDLQADWTLYGETSFEFIVLEELPSSNAMSAVEQAWIDRMKGNGAACYNKAIPYEYAPLPPLRWEDFIQSMSRADLIKSFQDHLLSAMMNVLSPQTAFAVARELTEENLQNHRQQVEFVLKLWEFKLSLGREGDL